LSIQWNNFEILNQVVGDVTSTTTAVSGTCDFLLGNRETERERCFTSTQRK